LVKFHQEEEGDAKAKTRSSDGKQGGQPAVNIVFAIFGLQ